MIEPSFGFDARVRAANGGRAAAAVVSRVCAAAEAGVFRGSAAGAERVDGAPAARQTTPSAASLSPDEQFQMIEHLGVLENYDMLTKSDVLAEVPGPGAADGSAEPATATRQFRRRALKMFLRRLTFALGLALMLALGAQTAPAQGRLRVARQERAQTWRQRAQARRERARANRAARGDAKAAQSGRDANKPANGGGVARPPNQSLFNPNPNAARRLPPGAVQRLRDMSPEQQERFLNNNQRFQALAPDKQAQIRRNLQKWNNLSPAEKDRLSHAERNWERLNQASARWCETTCCPRGRRWRPIADNW